MKNRILNYMKEHGSITSWEAINTFGCTRLSAVIFVLRQEGHHIISRREYMINRYGIKTPFARYILVKDLVKDNE